MDITMNLIVKGGSFTERNDIVETVKHLSNIYGWSFTLKW